MWLTEDYEGLGVTCTLTVRQTWAANQRTGHRSVPAMVKFCVNGII
jgi:hypothetical protein